MAQNTSPLGWNTPRIPLVLKECGVSSKTNTPHLPNVATMSLCHQLFTYFSVTINNPDENDMLIVRNPNEKYVRQCIWTNETGTEGTPHIQMFIRLHRNNALSLVKKLYPRAHIRGCAKDEYVENTQQYAQKDDPTTRGSHVITTSDTPRDAVDILQECIRRLQVYPKWQQWYCYIENDVTEPLLLQEDEMVKEKPYLAKMFVGNAYKQVKSRFLSVLWDGIHSNNKQTNNPAEQSVEIPVATIHTHAPAQKEDDCPPTRSTSPSLSDASCSYYSSS